MKVHPEDVPDLVMSGIAILLTSLWVIAIGYIAVASH